jgi:hypothetical protein
VTLKTDLFETLSPIVDGEVYPSVAAPGAVLPWITYHSIGGRAVNFLDLTLPGRRHARVQINVWARTRLQADEIAQTVENAMRLSTTLRAEVLGAAEDTYEPEPDLYGTRQDFGIWHTT